MIGLGVALIVAVLAAAFVLRKPYPYDFLRGSTLESYKVVDIRSQKWISEGSLATYLLNRPITAVEGDADRELRSGRGWSKFTPGLAIFSRDWIRSVILVSDGSGRTIVMVSRRPATALDTVEEWILRLGPERERSGPALQRVSLGYYAR